MKFQDHIDYSKLLQNSMFVLCSQDKDRKGQDNSTFIFNNYLKHREFTKTDFTQKKIEQVLNYNTIWDNYYFSISKNISFSSKQLNISYIYFSKDHPYAIANFSSLLCLNNEIVFSLTFSDRNYLIFSPEITNQDLPNPKNKKHLLDIDRLCNAQNFIPVVQLLKEHYQTHF